MPAPDPERGDGSEARFVTIETKIAYQEKTIADLNDVVTDQARTLERCEKRLHALEEQLKSLIDAADSQGERPPHY